MNNACDRIEAIICNNIYSNTDDKISTKCYFMSWYLKIQVGPEWESLLIIYLNEI